MFISTGNKYVDESLPPCHIVNLEAEKKIKENGANVTEKPRDSLLSVWLVPLLLPSITRARFLDCPS